MQHSILSAVHSFIGVATDTYKMFALTLPCTNIALGRRDVFIRPNCLNVADIIRAKCHQDQDHNFDTSYESYKDESPELSSLEFCIQSL